MESSESPSPNKPGKIEQKAESIREYSQYIVGILIFISLIGRIIVRFEWYKGPIRPQFSSGFWHNIVWFLSQNTLSIIGDGLALSAGIDLAYMLFTPGPDEVITPLLTAISATVVLIISNDDKLNLQMIEGVFLLIISMCVLLILGFCTGLISEEKNNLLMKMLRKKIDKN
jgi:hypothetical protein